MIITLSQRAAAIALLPKFTGRIHAFALAVMYQTEYKEHVDWHEMSYLLDELNRKGIVKHVGIDRCGRNEYELCK